MLVSDGALAGSASTLMDCVRTAVKGVWVPLETAIACAIANQPNVLVFMMKEGSISVGKKADMVLLDQELKIRAVIKDGYCSKNQFVIDIERTECYYVHIINLNIKSEHEVFYYESTNK